MGPPLDTNRVVHLAFAQAGEVPGLVTMHSWIDPTVIKDAQPADRPKVISELGAVTVSGFTGADASQGWANHPAYAAFSLDLRCSDGHLIAKRFKLRASWRLKQGGHVQQYDGAVELELKPDGTVAPVSPGTKHGELDHLPLGRRYAGTIDVDGDVLRARAPNGVAVEDARWYSVGSELVPTADPLAVELRDVAAGANVTCAMRVAGGLCVATWQGA
jgi:hypothetical protein